jgi:predicted RNA-binding protein YlxR (DUF448 family)
MTRGGMTKSRGEPERRCIATGESGPTDLLVRFVLGPDAAVVPDLAERLPGRGVWLTARRALVDKAVTKKLFSRAFRSQALAPADLADRLEALLAQRLIDVISLARKAGQAVTGFEKVRARLKDGTAGALIQASDAADDGKTKLSRLADGLAEGAGKQVPRIEILDSAELGLAFGRDFAIHAALDRGGFADRAIGEAARLCGLRPTDAPTDKKRQISAQTGEQSGARSGDVRQGGPVTVPGQGDR